MESLNCGSKRAVEPQPKARRWLATAMAIALSAPAGFAAVVIENSPPTVDGGSTLSAVDWKALLFTSGPTASVIDSIQLGLNPPSGATLPASLSVKVSLYTVVGGVPAAALGATDLVPVEMSATRQLYTVAGVPEFSLDPGTSYALVVSSDATGMRWANRTGSTPTTSDGFQFDQFLATGDAGGSWLVPPSQSNVLLLDIIAVPETEWTGLATGAGLLTGGFVWRHRRLRNQRTI